MLDLIVKPRISSARPGRWAWQCIGLGITGYGPTPSIAYGDWHWRLICVRWGVPL